MKRVVIIAFLLVSAISTSFAQERGDKSIAIDAGFNFSYVDEESSFSFQLQPQFNYFVANNCQLSIGVGYGFSNHTHTFLVNPGFNYYVKLVEGLYYTPGISLAGGVVLIDDEAIPLFGVNLDLLGLEFRPTPKLGFTFHACSLTYMGLFDEYFMSNSVSWGFNAGSTLGLSFYF